MADEEAKTSSPAKSRDGLKVAMVVVAVLALQVGAIFTWWTIWGPGAGPKRATPGEKNGDGVVGRQKQAEVLVVEDKFVNSQTGENWLYDVKVVITVVRTEDTQKFDKFKTLIEGLRARISFDFGEIIRSARPSEFTESNLTQLRDKMMAKLNERIGNDPDGNQIVKDVWIEKLIPLRRL